MKNFLLATALLLAFSAFSQIEVSEINYNSDSTFNSGNWVEIRNRGNTTVNLTGWQMTDASPFHIFNFPVNQTLAPGAYLVIADDTVKFKNIFPGVTNVIGELGYGLSNNSDTITIYDNNGSVVYNMAYWDSSPWQKTADGLGRTLELRNPGADPTLPQSWFAGCIGGSPGVGYAPCNEPLIVTEVNYNSILQFDPGDWIELHNQTDNPLNLSGWILKDSEDTNVFVFPPGTIIPQKGYLVVVHDSVRFKQQFPNVLNYVAQMKFNLSNSGDRIRIYNAQTGRIQYSLVFNDKAPWPLAADGQGYTLELIDYNGIMNDAANWQIGCFGGSPGKAYDPGCGTDVAEIGNDFFDVTLLGNPVNDFLQFRLNGTNENTIVLTLIDLAGKKVMEQSGLANGVYKVEVEKLSPGMYFAVVTDGANQVVSRFTKQ
ncbi:MAG: lamin tail domain-containing protein [Chitinophagales bacterium]|nr:lamin tail domain-containing protein [Chitinophagales bacterium]